MKKIKIILSLIVFGFLINSCNNDDTKSSYPYTVKMTDAPGPYDAVNVDIQGVEVTGQSGESFTLNVVPGIYNLLNFSNGVSTLIATDTLEISKVEQIRLILGTNNRSTEQRNLSFEYAKCRSKRIETSGASNPASRNPVQCIA